MKFYWNKPLYGRLLRDRYPGEMEYYEHRAFGLKIGRHLIGWIVKLDK